VSKVEKLIKDSEKEKAQQKSKTRKTLPAAVKSGNVLEKLAAQKE
jgi:hypothetical protein